MKIFFSSVFHFFQFFSSILSLLFERLLELCMEKDISIKMTQFAFVMGFLLGGQRKSYIARERFMTYSMGMRYLGATDAKVGFCTFQFIEKTTYLFVSEDYKFITFAAKRNFLQNSVASQRKICFRFVKWIILQLCL